MHLAGGRFSGVRVSRPLEQLWACGPLRAGRPRSQALVTG